MVLCGICRVTVSVFYSGNLNAWDHIHKEQRDFTVWMKCMVRLTGESPVHGKEVTYDSSEQAVCAEQGV